MRPLEGIIESCWRHSSCIVLMAAIYLCWVFITSRGAVVGVFFGRAKGVCVVGLGGSLLIFINPVIKTKDGAVPFKSVLSGVHQVRASLPESGEDPVPRPNYRELLNVRCHCRDWSAASWNGDMAGNLRNVPRCQRAAELTAAVCTPSAQTAVRAARV